MKKVIITGFWILILLIQNVLANNVTQAVEALKNKTDNIYWMTVLIFILIIFYAIIYFAIQAFRWDKEKREGEL